MAILELKLDQEIYSFDQDPLLMVFLDLRKACDIIDCGRLLTTLEGCGAVPRMCRILSVFWDQQDVCTRKNRYHVPHFKATWGNTHSGLISPTLFNLLVDNVVRNWIMLTVEDQLVTQEGLVVVVGMCLGLFYADYGVVGSQDQECLQGTLNTFIRQLHH